MYETYNRDTSVYHPALDKFPTVDQAMDADPFEVDSGSFWVLERGEQPMACFDVRGHLHSMNGEVVDLMPIYREHSSSLTKTIGIALGDCFP